MKPQDRQADHLQQWSMEWVIKIHFRLDKQVQLTANSGGFFCVLDIYKSVLRSVIIDNAFMN
ncbi:hypothetical protein A3849_10395 [Paenibacillus sp. P46E]|nr:hypothetical protein A3849_10395 [Paenibacillus sp. P46E]